MKSTRRANQWQWRTLLLLGAMIVLFRSFAVAPGSPPVINSLAITGTNLVFNATFPLDIHQAILEIRPTLGTPWQETAQLEIPAGGGEVVFSIPKPELESAFFRLKATTDSTTAAQLSAELQYVTMPPLGPVNPNDPAMRDAVFHFRGKVDGSDRILITRQGALWEHVNWGWPAGAVTINDTQWNPLEKNCLTTTGAVAFLPEQYSLDAARLEIIQGRDVIALERAQDSLIVYIDDTPKGADDYEFRIHFPTVPARATKTGRSPTARLKIAAKIDGSDFLKITAQNATWQHQAFAYPREIQLNGMAWDVRKKKQLSNSGETSFLPPDIDLSTTRIVSRTGRDLATAWVEGDALWIHFADNPNGTDAYELEIAFGR